jgi:hypothetical protein
MTPDQIKMMAQNSLKALNDERGMIPTMYANAIADLKGVLMGMMTGQIVIDNARKSVVQALHNTANGAATGEQPTAE